MIYVKTDAGQVAFKNKSAELTAAQRAAFIMFDGKRNSEDVLKTMAWMGLTQGDLDRLVEADLLMLTEAPLTVPALSVVAANSEELSHNAAGQPTLSAQEHYAKAYPIAARLTSGLGLRGFMLNLAVERATDIDDLKVLGPKIRAAVGAEKYKELEAALHE